MPVGCWGLEGTQRRVRSYRPDEGALTRAIIALVTWYGRYGSLRIVVKL
jgi:hypothetical protein